MTVSEKIDSSLSLLYSSKWNLKKREKAFSMLCDIFNEHQLAIIQKGYQSGLTRECLQLMLYPGFSWQQMLIIEAELHELPVDKVWRLANPAYSIPQMQIIAEGIRSGLSAEQLNYLIKHKHSLTEMKIVLGAFKNGVTEEELLQCYREIKNRE